MAKAMAILAIDTTRTVTKEYGRDDERKETRYQETKAKQQIVRQTLTSSSTAKLYSLRQLKGNAALAGSLKFDTKATA